MQSPFVVGLLSVIPGLGFFVLGQPKRGFGAIGIIIGLFIFGLFVPSQFFSQLSFQFFILAWVGQIYYAVQTAKLIKRQEAGEVVAPREMPLIAPAPDNLSANEKIAYKMREIVRHQLNIGEHLVGAIMAQTMPSMGSHLLIGAAAGFTMRMYYVGLTENTLIMIEQDFLGKPADLKRIPLTNIKSSKFDKGWLTDSLVLDFGEKKPMELRVTFRLREQTQLIFAGLQKQRAG